MTTLRQKKENNETWWWNLKKHQQQLLTRVLFLTDLLDAENVWLIGLKQQLYWSVILDYKLVEIKLIKQKDN
jgi:hypothetical protein